MSVPLPEVPCNDPTLFCRLCFAQGDINWVIRTCGTEIDQPFVETIGQCLGIWLQLDEDFPCAICRMCTFRLEQIVEFRASSHLCDEALRSKRQHDPGSMVLFYDYPADKVFFDTAPRDDPDFYKTPDEVASADSQIMLEPEVSVDDHPMVDISNCINPTKFLSKSKEEKLKDLQSYFKSYVAWRANVAKIKDDDEETIVAPESYQTVSPTETPTIANKSINLNECLVCKRRFKTSAPLDLHVAKWHPTSRTADFVCPKCPKTFRAYASLSHHYYRIHKKINLAVCKECGEQFRSSRAFELHFIQSTCTRPEPRKSNEQLKAQVEQKGRCIVLLDPLPQELIDTHLVDKPSLPVTEEEIIDLDSSNQSVTQGEILCTLCFDQFANRGDFVTHTKRCYIAKSSIRDKAGHRQQAYNLCHCGFCFTVLEDTQRFIDHLHSHKDPYRIKPHDCDQCLAMQPCSSPPTILGD